MRAARDQPGEMRHVDQQVCADLVGDLAEALEVPEARIGAAAAMMILGLLSRAAARPRPCR